jgi:hypothetical protein
MIRHKNLRLTGLTLAFTSWSVALWGHTAYGQGKELTVLRGRVLGTSAEPIPNARVDISTAVPKSGPSIFCPSCYLDCRKWAKTDESGRFEIKALDATLKFRLVVSAAGYKTMVTDLLTPDGTSFAFQLEARPKAIDRQRMVSGIVKNELGIPVSGALITPVAAINPQGLRAFYSKGMFPAVSDAKGYFEIDLADETVGIDAEIRAEGSCGAKVVGLVPGDQRKDFMLPEGVSIVGRVQRNGQPMPGMTIAVAQTNRGLSGENFFLQAIPAVCDPEGRFEIKHLPPNQEYCVYSVIGEANRSNVPWVVETRLFDAPASGKIVDIGALEAVQPIISFAGRLVLPNGTAPTEVGFVLLRRDPAWDSIRIPVESDGSFHISGLTPEVYEIGIAGKSCELDAERMDSPLWTEKSIKRLIDQSTRDFVLPVRVVSRNIPDLAPNGSQTLAGRVTSAAGGGLQGILVSASGSVETLGKGLGNGAVPWTTTSDEGRFVLSELPDMRVWLKLYRPDQDGIHFWYLSMVKPQLDSKDVHITLGTETTFRPDRLTGRVQ